MASDLKKVQRFTKKARSAKRARQWKQVYASGTRSGKSKGRAIREANAVVRDTVAQRSSSRS